MTVNSHDGSLAPATGIEWLCVPDGNAYNEDSLEGPVVPVDNRFGSNQPLFWPEHFIGTDFSQPLPGLRLQARAYTQSTSTTPPVPPGVDPNTGLPTPGVPGEDTYTRTYPQFYVHSYTMEPQNRPRFFETEIGNETTTFSGAVNGYASIGINSNRPEGDVVYSWTSVFDQSEFRYIPRLTKPDYTQEPPMEPEVEATTGYPNEPYDTESAPPVYPMDAVTAFNPDVRETVVLEYKVTIVWNVGNSANNNPVTSEIILHHTVRQPVFNWGQLLAAEIAKTYYGAGYYPETGREDQEPIYES